MAGGEPLAALGRAADHSWLEQLVPDPETETYAPNKRSRQVLSGHYVRVAPSPLPRPQLLIHSPPVASMLGITPDEVKTEAFAEFFSGTQSRVPDLKSWCTPYALSIMGERMTSNCPFGNGNGYGDGRANSIGEVVVDGKRWEMQLKGAGQTPFCRGADGRAVLRSSIREFLASEAMHALGIETTRGLSLVVSGSEKGRRPWYSEGSQNSEPDRMIEEPCAISTRVATSFLRVGHLDLFSRRVMKRDATEQQQRELAMMVKHALFREYPDVLPGAELPERAEAMLSAAAERFGRLIAGWLRVGFCQGNFNADNCLIGGRTMDYGPFGWMDRYDPSFAKWVGSGQHFAFINQPEAMIANYFTLFQSIAPILSKEPQEAQRLFEEGTKVIKSEAADAWRQKLGFATKGHTAAAELWDKLNPMMSRAEVDFTIFFRQLAHVAELPEQQDKLKLFEPVACAFYKSAASTEAWADWLVEWRTALVAEGAGDLAAAATRLRAANPKYVPREWILAECYTQASIGDYSVLHDLYKIFTDPYSEHPEFEARYYRKADEVDLRKGGIAKMT